ncbi:MAG: cell division protein FtsL [Eubacteriales bacterium]|nr:cell division protein FtsL [Eubacteriales bacterium]
MAATQRVSQRAGKRQTYRRSEYVTGTAVRQLQPERELERRLEQPGRRLSHEARKNREKAKYMNFAYVLFLTAALAVTGFVLIGYIRMESAITQSVKKVASLESKLNNIRTQNDETLGRIESSIDLEEIRRIAITELGMTYAGEGQIVEIPDEGSDYVRQYADIDK